MRGDEPERGDGLKQADDGPQGAEFHVVGIGASAGGVTALQEVFAALPPEPGTAFIVIQHLAPTRSSHMADILARSTAMTVAQAEDGMRIEPDHVYTIPPDRFLRIEDGCLKLSEPFREAGRQLPIDFLFRSLAEAQHEKAVGIVLSGTGSDGALGIREIRAAGGLTMAQDPQTAEFASMPEHAIGTGAVDYVLGPAQMGERLISYVRSAYPLAGRAGQEPTGDAVEQILNVLALRTNKDFRPYKRNTIRRRIERRMGINQIGDVQSYLEMVKRDEKEAQELSREMLIGVTSFFREPEAFEALRDKALRDIVRRKPEQAIVRVWVPGCATGEEAYSVAMLLQEVMLEEGKKCGVQLFATDVDERALETARRGVYPESIAGDVSSARLERFFVKLDGSYKVSEQLRESLVFAPHDLLNEPPFSNLDLISCRNLLIYLESEAQRKVLALFAFALTEGGYMFMGRSDALSGRDELFEVVSPEHRLFRRSDGTQRMLEFPATHAQRAVQRRAGVAAPAGRLEPRRLAELNQRALLQHFRAAVVLARRNGEIVHFFGPVGRYLEHPTGVATLTLADLADEHMAQRLMPALRKAAEENATVTLRSVVAVRGDSSHRVNVTMSPVPGPGEEDLFSLVFEEVAAPTPLGADQGPGEPKEIFGELQAELRATKEDYRTTVVDLETANEELRAANEEVTSMNEELQATNEELQSSQEELQSVNEELQTLNDQLNLKIAELRESNDDLTNVFRVAGIATIFVDTHLRLRRLAEPASRVINVVSSDVGRPLTDITHQLLDVDPSAEARAVLEDLAKVEKEVRSKDGRWHLMRAVPYRTGENRIDGVVMTFTDVTALKSAEQSLRELNATLELRVAEATALSQKRAEKLRQLALKLTNAEQRERHYLAQVLHDSIQQNLAAARLHIMTAAGKLTDLQARAAAETAAELLRETIGTTRTLTTELCPAPLYTGGLEAALQSLARHMEQRFGLKTSLHASVAVEPGLASRVLVYRTVQELLTNVSKHAGTGAAEVGLIQHEVGLQVTVSDSGSGFDVEEMEKGEHEGFGLFSIRERIQALGGSMNIESSAEQGTRVTIEMPLLVEDEDEEPGVRYAHAGPAEQPEAAKLRVLIADDHEIVRCALADMLSFHEGLRVIAHAANGREAVEKAWEVLPDIVLMDVRMPEMDGIEATRRIVSELPGTVVIGLSAQEGEAVGRQMMAAGAVAHVDKGGPPEVLFEVIRRFAPSHG